MVNGVCGPEPCPSMLGPSPPCCGCLCRCHTCHPKCDCPKLPSCCPKRVERSYDGVWMSPATTLHDGAHGNFFYNQHTDFGYPATVVQGDAIEATAIERGAIAGLPATGEGLGQPEEEGRGAQEGSQAAARPSHDMER